MPTERNQKRYATLTRYLYPTSSFQSPRLHHYQPTTAQTTCTYLWGRSPVCVIMCLVRSIRQENALVQSLTVHLRSQTGNYQLHATCPIVAVPASPPPPPPPARATWTYLWGRSPVCVIMCVFRLPGVMNALVQSLYVHLRLQTGNNKLHATCPTSSFQSPRPHRHHHHPRELRVHTCGDARLCASSCDTPGRLTGRTRWCSPCRCICDCRQDMCVSTVGNQKP